MNILEIITAFLIEILTIIGIIAVIILIIVLIILILFLVKNEIICDKEEKE